METRAARAASSSRAQRALDVRTCKLTVYGRGGCWLVHTSNHEFARPRSRAAEPNHDPATQSTFPERRAHSLKCTAEDALRATPPQRADLRRASSACRSPTGELSVPRSPTGELSVPISDGRGTPLRAARWRPGQVHPRAQPDLRSECAAAAAPAQSGVLVAARALWNWKPTPAGASPRRWSLQRRGPCQWRSRSFEVRLCARWPLQPPCRPQPCSSSPCVSHELPSPPPPQR